MIVFLIIGAILLWAVPHLFVGAATVGLILFIVGVVTTAIPLLAFALGSGAIVTAVLKERKR